MRRAAQIIFRAFLLSCIMALAIGSKAAFAATSSTSFTVTANVLASCQVNTTNLDFGNYSAASSTPTDATSTISVTCNPGQNYSISLDAGQGSGATVASRLLTSGANTLSYGLYTTGAYSALWGDGTLSTATVSATGSGSQQSRTVYGRLAAGQYTAPGTYLDTIAVAVTY